MFPKYSKRMCTYKISKMLTKDLYKMRVIKVIIFYKMYGNGEITGTVNNREILIGMPL